MYTHLDVLSWDAAVNRFVLKNKHNIMHNVKVMEAYIVT